MKKIIVPTDFSKVSMEGLFFAIHIASKIGASVEVVHVYSGTISPGQPIIVQTTDTYHEAALQQMNKFISEVLEDKEVASKGVAINGKAVVGFPEIELVEESANPDTALIIMSTTGSHGISGKIFGTVSTLLARKAKCPVLLVPKNISYLKINDMMFASAFLNLNEALLDNIKKYAKIFDAKVHCVHIQEIGESKKKLDTFVQKLEHYCSKDHSFDFSVNILELAESISETLNQYVQEHNIGMTVMVAPKRSFFDAVFHRSKTKEMAFSSTVPLLVFH